MLLKSTATSYLSVPNHVVLVALLGSDPGIFGGGCERAGGAGVELIKNPGSTGAQGQRGS